MVSSVIACAVFTMTQDVIDLNFDVVVARYKEDISWLAPIAKHCVIYNKGPHLDTDIAFKQIVFLPNVGREAHTYLSHILDRWHDLAPVTVFIQGRITDHIPKQYAQRPSDYVLELVRQAKISKIGVSLNADAHRKGSMSAAPFFKMSRLYPYITDTGMVFGEWLLKHVCVPLLGPHVGFPLKPIRWYVGALFAARREALHKTPRAIYDGLLKEVEISVDPEAGYFMERTWHYLVSEVHESRTHSKSIL